MEIKNYSCMKKIILEKLKAKFEGVSDSILDRIAEITRLEYTRVDNTFTFGSGGGNGQDIR